jgi:hypothetical protein
MKAGDVSEVRTSTRETWLSTPLSDPNAGLWASITPPANPTLTMLIQRRARAFSLDMLAHRLFVRFPGTFSSRASARLGILGSALALSAAAAGAGYLAVEPASGVPAFGVHAPAAVDASSAEVGTSTRFVRLGETAIDSVAPSRAPTVAATPATPAAAEQAIAPLNPRTALANDVGVEKNGKTASAKSTVAKKKPRGTSRRPAKARRARAAEP